MAKNYDCYPEHYETCDLTKTKDKCLIKSVVYKIKCKYCNSFYIGETAVLVILYYFRLAVNLH